MSATANWSYTNTASVKSFVGIDEWGKKTYSSQFEIACTWGSEKIQERNKDSQGAEFTIKNEIFTEDNRVKHLDLIKLNGHDEWEEVLAVTEFDMSFFNEIPDYSIITK